MSDYLTVLLIMTCVGLLLLIPSAYFGGKIGVIIVASILTILSCYILVWGIGIGKSFSNSHASTSLNSDTILQFLSFTTLYAFLAYSCFCFSQVLHGINGYKTKSLVCLVILFGYPMFLFIRNNVSLHSRLKKNYSNEIIIAHPKDFPILIDRIKFCNSKTKEAFHVSYNFYETDRKLYQIEGLPDKSQFMQSQRYYTQKTKHLIPISFDSFELSWYSILENKFYKDIFPIDTKNLKIGENYDKQLTINDFLIHILPNGHVDLLKREYTNYTHLISYFDIKFRSVEGQSIDSIWKNNSQVEQQYLNSQNLNFRFEKLKRGTVTKLTPEEILSFRSVFSFGINIEIDKKDKNSNTLKNIKIIDFYLNQYSRSVNFLRTASEKPLPSLIRIEILDNEEEKHWVSIVFDKKKLFDQYTNFIKINNKDVLFQVNLNIENVSKSKIWLKSKGQKISIDGWDIKG